MKAQTSDWEAALQRLETLELHNRRLKQMGAVVLALAASVLLLGQTASKRTVEANEFILSDANEKHRAALTLDETKGPSLTLYDANQKERVRLALSDRGARMVFLDGNGSERVTLSVENDITSLRLSRPEGSSVSLDVATLGAGMAVTDKDGFKTAIGTTGLLTRGTAEMCKTSSASVVLSNKDNRVIWKAP